MTIPYNMMQLKSNHNILYIICDIYTWLNKIIEELHMIKSNEITDIHLG
jgi:hypothetical protein